MKIRLYLEKKEIPEKEACQIIRSLGNRKILLKNGGFIFKCFFINQTLLFGIAPAIDEGVRNMHYDIYIPKAESVIFSGFLNTDYSFGILPINQPKNYKTSVKKNLIVSDILNTIQILTEKGLDDSFYLDWITSKFLNDCGFSVKSGELVKKLPKISAKSG